MTATSRRGPGRPRDEAIDSAILEATIEELIERGFLAMTMESVAVRAGVAKTTLYRRWSNIHDLALAAMRTFEQEVIDPPEGSLRDQLLFVVEAMRSKWGDPRYAALMRRVAADGTVQPATYRATRDTLIRPHVRLMNDIIARGIASGEIRSGVPVEQIRRLITSPIMATALTLQERVTPAQARLYVDTVLAGLRPARD